jgi:hypothetical protein
LQHLPPWRRDRAYDGPDPEANVPHPIRGVWIAIPLSITLYAVLVWGLFAIFSHREHAAKEGLAATVSAGERP